MRLDTLHDRRNVRKPKKNLRNAECAEAVKLYSTSACNERVARL